MCLEFPNSTTRPSFALEILHILQLVPITPGSILLNYNLVAQKRENPEPILTVKRVEWRKFVD